MMLGQFQADLELDPVLVTLRALRAQILTLPQPTYDKPFIDAFNRDCERAGTHLQQSNCALDGAEVGLSFLRGQGLSEWIGGYENHIEAVRAMPLTSNAGISAFLYMTVLDAFVREIPPWIDSMEAAAAAVRAKATEPWEVLRKSLTTDAQRGLNTDVEAELLGRMCLPILRDVALMRSVQLQMRVLIDGPANVLLQPGYAPTAVEGESLSLPAGQLLNRMRAVTSRTAQIQTIGSTELHFAVTPIVPDDDDGEASVPSEDGGDSGKKLPFWGVIAAGVAGVIVIGAFTRKKRDQDVSGFSGCPMKDKYTGWSAETKGNMVIWYDKKGKEQAHTSRWDIEIADVEEAGVPTQAAYSILERMLAKGCVSSV